jgi:hypothetical protein
VTVAFVPGNGSRLPARAAQHRVRPARLGPTPLRRVVLLIEGNHLILSVVIGAPAIAVDSIELDTLLREPEE